MSLEIERKFLLKSLPSKEPVEKIDIHQWYLKNSDGVWERARSCYSDINGAYFVHTIKKSIDVGINDEQEKYMGQKEFNQFVEDCKLNHSRYISKRRFIYFDGDLKWEVDLFTGGHHLIVAELEIPTIDFQFDLPKFISDKLIMEVTGFKQFSNRNLSNKLNKKSKSIPTIL
jgi:CYTH domain-containing protein